MRWSTHKWKNSKHLKARQEIEARRSMKRMLRTNTVKMISSYFNERHKRNILFSIDIACAKGRAKSYILPSLFPFLSLAPTFWFCLDVSILCNLFWFCNDLTNLSSSFFVTEVDLDRDETVVLRDAKTPYLLLHLQLHTTCCPFSSCCRQKHTQTIKSFLQYLR